MDWISVRSWRRFQHYDPAKRVPPWIKNNTELLHDSAYLGLTGDQRSILHGLWLEYASARCQLPADPRSLTRRLNLRVTMAQLKSLVDAGFIAIVASKTLAEGYHAASARAHDAEVETEEEEETEPKAVTSTLDPDDQDEPIVGGLNGLGEAQHLQAKVAASLRSI